MPAVFISYSHDSDAHRDHVLALAQRLRTDGIDVQLDRYVAGSPPEGWPRWMMNRLDEAEFVLVVCTETYYRRFRGHKEPGKGKGTDWEGQLVTNEIYEACSKSLKFVPLLLGEDVETSIPEPLRGWTYYRPTTDVGYQQLFAFLAGVAGVVPAPIGKLVVPTRIEVPPLTFPDRLRPERIATTRLTHVPSRIFGRDERLAQLDAAWKDPRIHVVTLVAWGGVGKTSLVGKWADHLAARDYDGAAYFDWSFYSQGAKDHSNASADAFVDAALRFFGDSAIADSSKLAWDKGSRLAQLVGECRTLLVLDGLEPLQHPPGPLAGDLKDPAIRALLRGLAQKNAGLCIVTTRQRITDLERFEYDSAPCWELEHLTVDAGVELLESRGVVGSKSEKIEATEAVKGHALTLSLLGLFLKKAYGGDVRRRDQVKFSSLKKIKGGEHPFQVMAAYEKWLLGGGVNAARQLAVLRLIGLFDRPASYELMATLRHAPAIGSLTKPLVDIDDEDLMLTLAELATSYLISEKDGTLDSHPLVREYFGRQLFKKSRRDWCLAHSRIFDWLQQNSTYHPEGLAALQPLYQAMHHGCQAGRQEEALVSV
jgi:hypothetical protein